MAPSAFPLICARCLFGRNEPRSFAPGPALISNLGRLLPLTTFLSRRSWIPLIPRGLPTLLDCESQSSHAQSFTLPSSFRALLILEKPHAWSAIVFGITRSFLLDSLPISYYSLGRCMPVTATSPDFVQSYYPTPS